MRSCNVLLIKKSVFNVIENGKHPLVVTHTIRMYTRKSTARGSKTSSLFSRVRQACKLVSYDVSIAISPITTSHKLEENSLPVGLGKHRGPPEMSGTE